MLSVRTANHVAPRRAFALVALADPVTVVPISRAAGCIALAWGRPFSTSPKEPSYHGQPWICQLRAPSKLLNSNSSDCSLGFCDLQYLFLAGRATAMCMQHGRAAPMSRPTKRAWQRELSKKPACHAVPMFACPYFSAQRNLTNPKLKHPSV